MNLARINTALVSVSNKRGLQPLVASLIAHQVKILSTGGTAQWLRDHGFPVKEIAEYTGFPEIMQGRVKTLHPKVHGGLLGRLPQDAEVMSAQGIEAIDLVVVNLYPFQEVVKNKATDLALAIENIDIGGPSMLRSAAKNHNRVTVVIDPDDYITVTQALAEHDGSTPQTLRQQLAAKVFAATAHYDVAIANYLTQQFAQEASSTPNEGNNDFAAVYAPSWQKHSELRYGENPHQRAAFYTDPNPPAASIGTATQHQGKPLSFNNIVDANAALACVKQFAADEPTCVILKHENPCGVACCQTQLAAYQSALAGDPTSAFGGIIAFNSTLTAETAAKITDGHFVEVIIAPMAETAAQEILAKKPNIRLLTFAQAAFKLSAPDSWLIKAVSGGILVQTQGQSVLQLTNQTQQIASTTQEADLRFAWRVASRVKSNAIVIAKDQATLGIGAGQMSRIDSVELAIKKAKQAGHNLQGAVLASDGFFPFADGIETAAQAGIQAVIQPGGSMRDKEVIAAADRLGIAMLFTGVRHFLH